jgi:hypothetical protein
MNYIEALQKQQEDKEENKILCDACNTKWFKCKHSFHNECRVCCYYCILCNRSFNEVDEYENSEIYPICVECMRLLK